MGFAFWNKIYYPSIGSSILIPKEHFFSKQSNKAPPLLKCSSCKRLSDCVVRALHKCFIKIITWLPFPFGEGGDNQQQARTTAARGSWMLWVGVFRGLFLGGKYQPGMSLGHSLTSQVSQRPQQASVVTLSPRQPGFLARKVNSLTAQPTNVRRSMAEALVGAPRPDSSRTRRAPRVRQWNCMLMAEGEEGWVGLGWVDLG